MATTHWDLADLDHAPESDPASYVLEKVNCKKCLDDAIAYYSECVREDQLVVDRLTKTLWNQIAKMQSAKDAREKLGP